MSSQTTSAQRRRELANLVLVVLFIGLISNILASYLGVEILKENLAGVSVAMWLVLILVILTATVSYTLVLNPIDRRAAIYTNLMVNRGTRSVHFSIFAPLAIQHAETLWRALINDKSPFADRLIENLHKSESDALSLDLVEYLVFLFVLSGFDLFWASSKIKSYGYPTRPIRLGDVPRFGPSRVYSIQKPDASILKPVEKQLEFQNVLPIVQHNQLAMHFLGNTSLEYLSTPKNWLIIVPKGTQISSQSTSYQRIIRLSNRYSTINLTITKSSVATGLPYAIGIKEKNYVEKEYFSTDFRIDFVASFSRLLSINPKIDDYHNWVNLILSKLVANFSLSQKGIIEEVELP